MKAEYICFILFKTEKRFPRLQNKRFQSLKRPPQFSVGLSVRALFRFILSVLGLTDDFLALPSGELWSLFAPSVTNVGVSEPESEGRGRERKRKMWTVSIFAKSRSSFVVT